MDRSEERKITFLSGETDVAGCFVPSRANVTMVHQVGKKEKQTTTKKTLFGSW